MPRPKTNSPPVRRRRTRDQERMVQALLLVLKSQPLPVPKAEESLDQSENHSGKQGDPSVDREYGGTR